MKKFFTLPTAVFGLLFLSVSCGKSSRLYEITGGECSINYSVSQDETFLFARCWLLSRNAAHAKISGWRITFRSGKNNLLEVNDANYLAYAPYVNFWDIYAYDAGVFILQTDDPDSKSTREAYPGKLFPSALPDNMDIRLTLTDADGKTEDVERNIEVLYSSVQ